MNEEQLKALITGNVNDSLALIRAAADQLSPADLARLEEMETQGANRATLLTAIDNLMAAQADLQGDDDQDDAGDPALGVDAVHEEAGKTARGERVEAWMKPDYSGPITIEMAEWRNKHLVTK